MESRLIGRVVNRRFRVEDVIGRGGMAIVYRAFDLKSHQTVALKVLREEYEEDPEYKERFRREAEVCRRLNHPNVVNLIGSGTVGGISYIALEYVDGKTLKELIAESGGIEQEQAVRYALQILAALGHAHQRGIIHRDVKPQNVMVSRAGQLKVGDFGIAGMAETQTLTSDGSVIGSVHYFSPEQAKGMKASAASDLYSVGVILYEMLSGHVPFEGETAVSVAMMHLMEPPKPIAQEAVVSPAVAMIVHKALQKKQSDRYQSADAMIRDLRRGLRHPDGEFLQQTRIQRPENKPIKKKRTLMELLDGPIGRLMALFVGLVLLSLIAVAGVRVYRSMFIVSRVPDLAGLDEVAAERMIEGAGLRARIVYAYSDRPEGFVSGQEPVANEEVDRGSSVIVTISRGSGQLVVQRFTGMAQEDAEMAIISQGFTVGDVQIVPSEVLRGTVLSQTPLAGESALIGSEIDMTVSGGRVVVPELTGEREEEALSRIESLGLRSALITYEFVDSAKQDGIVLTQWPEKFEEVLPDSEVELSVGYYDRRRYTATVSIDVTVPKEGVTVRVTLVDPDGNESDMYSARHETQGETTVEVLLRSETSGVMTWRLYLDGNFRSEATAVLQ